MYKINDGCHMLLRDTPATCRVDTFDFNEPFAFALQRPVSNGPVQFATDLTVTKDVVPDPEVIFRRTDAIMIPTESQNGEKPLLAMVYGDFLRKNFFVKDHSACWTLWVRQAGHEAER
jgi:hypothetical protein